MRYDELKEMYDELEALFEDARVHWNEDHVAGFGRKESYWQGKKDGLRVSMNLLYQLIQNEGERTNGT